MTMDELLDHYEQRLITRDELFGHAVELLSLDTLARVWSALDRKGWRDAFRPWLESIEKETETVAGGIGRKATAEARAAARRWLEAEEAIEEAPVGVVDSEDSGPRDVELCVRAGMTPGSRRLPREAFA